MDDIQSKETVLHQKIRDLPPDIQQEVIDFIEFLVQKRAGKRKKKLSLSWMGGLKEYRDKYTALELQKKALEWRD